MLLFNFNPVPLHIEHFIILVEGIPNISDTSRVLPIPLHDSHFIGLTVNIDLVCDKIVFISKNLGFSKLDHNISRYLFFAFPARLHSMFGTLPQSYQKDLHDFGTLQIFQ
jgi:hypothetical protein